MDACIHKRCLLIGVYIFFQKYYFVHYKYMHTFTFYLTFRRKRNMNLCINGERTKRISKRKILCRGGYFLLPYNE